MRRIVLISLSVLLVLVLALLGGGMLLLNTDWGLVKTLELASEYGPVEIEAETTSGSVLGGATVEGLRLRGDNWTLELDQVALDWSPGVLRNRIIDVDQLKAGHARLVLMPGDEQQEPFELPSLDFGWNVQLEQVDIDELTVVRPDAEPLVISDIRLAGELMEGRLALQTAQGRVMDRQVMLSGFVDSAADYRHRLELAINDTDQPLLSATLSGDRQRTVLDASAPPYAASARATLLDWTGDQARWQLEAVVDQWKDLDGLALSASGNLEQASAEVSGRWAGTAFEARDIEGRFADGLVVNVGQLCLPEQKLRTSLALSSEDLEHFTADARFRWDPPDHRLSGEASVQGTLDQYRIEAHGQIDELVDWTLAGSGTQQQLAPLSVRLSQQDSILQLDGQARWSPQVAWNFQLDGAHMDPSLIWPDWPADLAIAATASGNDQLADIELQSVTGTLLGQAMSAEGALRITPAGLEDLDLRARSGESQIAVAGQWAERTDLSGELDIADLGHFLAGADGSLQGSFSANENRLDLDLQGAALAWEDYTAEGLLAQGAIPLSPGVAADLTLQLSGLAVPGVALGDLSVDAQGPRSALTVASRLQSPEYGIASTRMIADLTAEPRRLQLIELEAENESYGQWALSQPTTLRIGEDQVQMDKACLRATAGGAACASFAMEPGRTGFAELELDAVRATLFELPLSAAIGEPLRLAGPLNGAARLETFGMQAVALTATLSSEQLQLHLVSRSPEPIVVEALEFSASGDQDQLQAQANAQVESAQLVADAALASPFDADRIIDNGQLVLTLPALSEFDEVMPSITGLQGRLTAELALSGRPSAPDLAGELRVDRLDFVSIEYGTRVSDGDIEVQLAPDGSFVVNGALPSAGGVLSVDGQGRLDGAALADLALVVRGDDIRLADSPDLRLLASPNLRLSSNGEWLRLRGRVVVDEAHVELGSDDAVVRPSPDVVVVREDAGDGEPSPPLGMPLDAQVEVVLGDAVTFSGYGIEAELDGEVTVIDRSGERRLARGAINLSGSYRIYGQELTIDDGRLEFAGTPIEDPGLSVDAYRQVQSVRAGVRVSGRASDPTVELYSEPPMEDSNILAYMLTGRPLDQTTEGEANYLADAAMALALRHGTEATTAIGSRLGFEQFGIAVREDIGGAAFSVGRYLAPNLYLRYSVGLVNPIDILELEYRLSDKWAVETELGIETRVGINYRVEKGRQTPPKRTGDDS